MNADVLLGRFNTLFRTADAVEQLRQLLFEGFLTGRTRGGDAQNWPRYDLDDCSTVLTGTSISASDKHSKYARVPGALPFIATKDVIGRDGEINYDTEVTVPEGEPGFRVAEPGTILICSEGGSAGRKIGVVRERVCFGNKLYAIIPNPELVTSAYLLRIFQSPGFLEQFQSKMKGIIGGISLANFKRLSVYLPPLPDQERIEARLAGVLNSCAGLTDALTAFSSARNAAAAAQLEIVARSNDEVARASSVQALLDGRLVSLEDEASIDNLRDAIIDASIRGKLSTNGPRRARAEDIASIDNRTGETVPVPPEEGGPFVLPPDWRWVRLASLVNPSRFISYGVIKLGDDDSSGIPVLRCSDVRYRRINLDSVKRVSPAIEEQYQRTRLKGGEVLLNIRGTLGGCAVVPVELAGYNIAREVAMVDPNSLVLAPYLLNVISSPYFRQAIESGLRGIAYKGINLGSLAEIPVPLPPIAIQAAIVEQVDALIVALEDVRTSVRRQEACRAQLLDALINQVDFNAIDNDSGSAPPGGDRGAAMAVTLQGLDNAGGPATPRPRGEDAAKAWPQSGLEEALLVGAIVDAFFQEACEPVGNFRIQKAVYFSKRRLGERNLDEQFLKKAAGPYNPTLRYEGGIAQAKSLNFIREAKGRFGFGYITGSAAAELRAHLDSHAHYREIARWIVGRLRFVDNEDWEVLATVDYATEALRKNDTAPSVRDVLAYIAGDGEWRPKIGRLSLTEPKVQRAMSFAQALFAAG